MVTRFTRSTSHSFSQSPENDTGYVSLIRQHRAQAAMRVIFTFGAEWAGHEPNVA
jgi:hypothetical protein